MLQGRITQDEYYAWQIAHSDIIGTDEMLTGYELPLEQQKELEAARRSIGARPAPVFDENHVNVMPITEISSSSPAKHKRKRKPKTK